MNLRSQRAINGYCINSCQHHTQYLVTCRHRETIILEGRTLVHHLQGVSRELLISQNVQKIVLFLNTYMEN